MKFLGPIARTSLNGWVYLTSQFKYIQRENRCKNTKPALNSRLTHSCCVAKSATLISTLHSVEWHSTEWKFEWRFCNQCLMLSTSVSSSRRRIVTEKTTMTMSRRRKTFCYETQCNYSTNTRRRESCQVHNDYHYLLYARQRHINSVSTIQTNSVKYETN